MTQQIVIINHQSIKSRLNKINISTVSQRKMEEGSLKMYSKLDKVDIFDELHERNIKFYQHQRKDILEKILVKEMHGIQRGPALLVNNNEEFDKIKQYEVLASEPMHDIAGDWKNLIEELPCHLNKQQKELFQNVASIALHKESKRAVDYRKAGIYLCLHLKGRININVYKILLSGCELQEMLYAGEEKRTLNSILRYQLQSYIHTYMLINLVGNNPKSLTRRKLYGKYFHAIN